MGAADVRSDSEQVYRYCHILPPADHVGFLANLRFRNDHRSEDILRRTKEYAEGCSHLILAAMRNLLTRTRTKLGSLMKSPRNKSQLPPLLDKYSFWRW